MEKERETEKSVVIIEEDEEKKVAFYKLFAFADKFDVVLMIVGAVAAVGNGLSQSVTNVIFGELSNSFAFSDKDTVMKEVSKVCLRYVYLSIGMGIASFLQESCWMITGQRQSTRIRGLYLHTILKQDIAFFDTETTAGEIVGRMSADTILIQDAFGENVGKFIQLISTFFGGFAIGFLRGWLLSLVLLSSLPAMALAAAAMSSIMSKAATRGQRAYAAAADVVEQILRDIRTVASFTGEKQAIEQYNKKLKIAYKSMVQQGVASGLGLGIVVFATFLSYGLGIWYGSKLIIDKGYDGGQIISVMLPIMTGGKCIGYAISLLNSFASGQAAAYKMFETIRRKPKIDPYDSSGTQFDDIDGEIEIRDVYFRYPARPDVQIFAGFSLSITSGATVALVGQSGSGKSTIISLLERFYDPDSGEVLIDGINLKKFRLKWIRERMGLVSQEPILFATTIKDNIAYGKENATLEEFRIAIELANATKFIDNLPKGLDTMVGQHGTQLSGGQKQRIAIARAILKNPKILLLDEATSALDAESERIVQDALVKVMSNRTTVVVAHRLTTIRNANTIAVIQQGKVVEKGTHADLIKDPDGAYSQLVHLQEGKEEPEVSRATNIDYVDRVFDIEKIETTSGSHRFSIQPPINIGSLSSRRSFTSSYNVPGPVNIHEAEVGDQKHESEVDVKKHKSVSITRLASLNKPELPILFLGSIAAAIDGVIFPLTGLLFANAIKTFYKTQSELKRESLFWAVVSIGLGCVALIIKPIQSYLFGVAGGKLVERIRSLTFEKVVYQENSWFDDPANSSGAVGARLSTDASTIKCLVGDTLTFLVQSISAAVAGLIIAFTSNWILAFVILSALPLIIGQGYLSTKFVQGFSVDAKLMYEEASQVASNAVGSIRTVASFCAERKVMNLYHEKCKVPVRNGVREGLVRGCSYSISCFVLYCTNAFCFYVGAILARHGKATFGEILQVFFALTIAGAGVSRTAAMAPDSNKAKDAAASIFDIIDSRPKIDSSSKEGLTLATVVGNLELEHVSFRYPARPDVQIFRNLCLKMPSGKTVALVGESGSGKSTIISLVERFYDPDEGRVLLDGVDVKRLKLSWLRQQLGLVSQEPILFNDTIRANIAYGKQGHAREEEIILATKSANAHNFISSLPDGYDTPVGERGMQLSGGQKQRIAIARAILKNPKILLLDEATSALDAESEHVVQDALDRVMVNRTTVIVAHRLATIRGADIIAVMKNGVIIENGRHEALMKIKDGAYASLMAIQMHSS